METVQAPGPQPLPLPLPDADELVLGMECALPFLCPSAEAPPSDAAGPAA